ncbi:MAG: hypothetical protein JWQ91_1837 [Aeromicrobium sp.]|jgi:hypothetical protein|uniref:hypothetical protein n=1 Tax=Aeromicrobium sp. TaxID=1871063 RepID=UPI0026130DA2|nr:hypothetical protein [Aeromicrobium sp.]MCW2789146.1 hypothetical protein [Aeromicrobium sp.]MCW2824920.1 hypothetical protein [Aeromicrobium sp.]
MVHAFTQDVPIDLPTYERIIAALGPEPLAGQLVHLCVRRPDGGLRYIDVWESVEACAAAFDDRIHPAVAEVLAANRPAEEPTSAPLDVLHMSGTGVSAVA